MTRLIIPILQTLVNASDNSTNKRFDHLRYIFLNIHGRNLAAVLKWLGYWEANGYGKAITFGSSLRFELVKRVEKDLAEKYYIQFIYDDEILKLPWCNMNGWLCPFDDLIDYAVNSLVMDPEYVEKFCRAEAGKDYIRMKRPKREMPRKD